MKICPLCLKEHKMKKGRKCGACLHRLLRKKNKQMAVAFMGGKCQRCNYNKCLSALHFHHLDPQQKDFHITDGKSWDKMKEELKKCVMLCANCHAEEHEKLVKQEEIPKLE